MLLKKPKKGLKIIFDQKNFSLEFKRRMENFWENHLCTTLYEVEVHHPTFFNLRHFATAVKRIRGKFPHNVVY